MKVIRRLGSEVLIKAGIVYSSYALHWLVQWVVWLWG